MRVIVRLPMSGPEDLVVQSPVNLKKTMLTYFEVEPHSRFETHSHKSERITMVVSGVLFVQIGQTVHRIGSGEVMAIPVSVFHAVWTESKKVNAVDACSPISKKYDSGRDKQKIEILLLAQRRRATNRNPVLKELLKLDVPVPLPDP
jgi:quercetin dioxygenase-like cupin family protein